MSGLAPLLSAAINCASIMYVNNVQVVLTDTRAGECVLTCGDGENYECWEYKFLDRRIRLDSVGQVELRGYARKRYAGNGDPAGKWTEDTMNVAFKMTVAMTNEDIK